MNQRALDNSLRYLDDWLRFQQGREEIPGFVVTVARKGKLRIDDDVVANGFYSAGELVHFNFDKQGNITFVRYAGATMLPEEVYMKRLSGKIKFDL